MADPAPYDLVRLLPDVGDLLSDQGGTYRVIEVRVARRVNEFSVSYEAVKVVDE